MLHQLLDNLERYLNGRCSLRDLEGWLVSNLQQIDDSGDERAIKIANEIDADLVWLGEGLIDDETFRERLDSYYRELETIFHVFSEVEHSTVVRGTAAAETLKSRREIVGQVVDLHLHLAFA